MTYLHSMYYVNQTTQLDTVRAPTKS